MKAGRSRCFADPRLVAVAWLAWSGFSSPGLHAAAGDPGVVVFGGDAAYPPFEWMENGAPTGFNIDLEDAIAEAGGRRAEHRLGDWPDTIRALENGDIDVVPMFRSREREQLFTFTSTFQYVYHAVFALSDATPLDSPQDLAGRRVVVEESSYAHQQLLAAGIDARLLLASNTHDALMHVADRRAEYALLAVPATFQLIHMHDLPITQTGTPMWPGEYAFAVRKDRQDLARWLRLNYADVVSSGRFDEVRQHWDNEIEGRRGLDWVLENAAVIVAPTFALVLLAAGWTWSLRRTVRLRTRELRQELQRRQEAEEHLRYLAAHDPHTGLPNTRSFLKRVEELLQDAGESSGNRDVLVMKLVERGRVGRIFGHDVSERLVRRFAARLEELGYPVCGYLGRGRFAVFSNDRPVEYCFELLGGRLMVDDLELHPSIVGGLARWNETSPTAHSLVRHAEIALSIGISRNLPCTTYDGSMEPDPLDLRIVMDFRKTAGLNLFPVFQPQVDLRTGQLAAAEALVRWRHPELGMIPPARFIPLLESVGLVSKVTQYMINEAVRVAATLRARGRPCPISVNVAAFDLTETELPRMIGDALVRYNGVATDLQLELTETSVAEDADQVRAAMQELHAMGMHISVDDFGTGHSSLSYLSGFPIQELKIDREFVFDMASSSRNRSIVRSTILMAHELGLLTVAEGAEDESTLETLREAGCDRVQGYVIAHPMPEQEFLAYASDDRIMPA